jgi:hypothetical protein
MPTIESLLKKLWPILKVRVVVLLADYVQTYAAKVGATLDDDDAAAIAAAAVNLIEQLLDRVDDPKKVTVAQRALKA